MEGRFASWGSVAFLAVGLCLAQARLLAWFFLEKGPLSSGLWDAAHVLLVSAVLALLSEVGRRLEGIRPWLPWAILALASMALGELLLQDDVGGFSRRQQLVPQQLAYHGVVGLISLGPIVGAALGRAVDEPRFRWGALVAAALLFAFGGTVLEGDYWGVHAFLILSALVGAGAAFWGATGRPRRLEVGPTLIAGLCLTVPALLLAPSPRAAVALSNSTGAPFSHFIAILRPTEVEEEASVLPSEWFVSRAEAQAIPPTAQRLLADPPLVILITVDALRADVVHSKKYDKLLPTLARLRDEGVSFTQARAPGTLTKTSLASVFMGNYFSQQYWSPMDNPARSMSVHADETPRFPELLSQAGVRTANFRAVSWLRNGVVMRGFEFEKLIKYPKEKSYYAPSPPVFKHLLPRVEKDLKAGKAAFVYTHLADPHAPYDQGKKKRGASFDCYLSEIELVDSQLARLVGLLDEVKEPDSVLLIVSADHGEAFGEHSSRTHGTTMYEEGLHVPLLFWRPGGRGRVIDDVVSLVDLGPTVLDLFGQPTPAHFMGQSLVPYLNGESPKLTRPIFAETRLMRALVTPERMKLIWDVRSNRLELYDLKEDPKELVNLADRSELLRPILGQMRAFFQVHTLKREGYRIPFVK